MRHEYNIFGFYANRLDNAFKTVLVLYLYFLEKKTAGYCDQYNVCEKAKKASEFDLIYGDCLTVHHPPEIRVLIYPSKRYCALLL